MIKNSPQLYPKNKLHRRESDGFVTFNSTTDTTVTLVPKEYLFKVINYNTGYSVMLTILKNSIPSRKTVTDPS